MTLATGHFTGFGQHVMRGGYVVREEGGRQIFETTDDFFFDGAPEPGFALSADGAFTRAAAEDTDFLRLAASAPVTGKLTAELPQGFHIADQRVVFLWCFDFHVLLGQAPVELET